jgi:O-antigen ligase
MFMLMTKNLFKKALWCIAMMMLGFALLLTYSRAGVVALMAAGCVMVWEFGLKGRRYGFLMMGGFIALCVMVVAGPKGYLQRIGSVIDPALDPGSASGSWHARRDLLILSIKTTLTHPIFGVGCNVFKAMEGADWHVTHNSYTQTSAEGGLLVLLFYLLIIKRTFQNLVEIEATARGDPELLLIGGALRVSFAAFLVGSFFDSVAYNFFPYFLVAYTGALLMIAKTKAGIALKAETPKGKGKKRLIPEPHPEKSGMPVRAVTAYPHLRSQ